MRQMMGVFALPSEMAFSAYQSNCPRAKEAVSVSPVMSVHAGSTADQTTTFVSVVDFLPKVVPAFRV